MKNKLEKLIHGNRWFMESEMPFVFGVVGQMIVGIVLEKYGLSEILLVFASVPLLIVMASLYLDLGLSRIHSARFGEMPDEAIEREFIKNCEGALEALPQNRRKEFRERLLESMLYYRERRSFLESMGLGSNKNA